MGPSHVPGGKHKVCQGDDAGSASLMLRNAETVEDQRIFRRRIKPCGLPDKFRGHIRKLGHPLRGIVCTLLLQFIKVFRAFLDEFFIRQPFLNDGMEHGVQERDVAAWTDS